MRDTQSLTPPTIRDAPVESCLLVTGNGLQSNRNELLGDNGVQQAPSTPKGEGPEAEALRIKSEEPGAEASRIQFKKTQTKHSKTKSKEPRAKVSRTQCQNSSNMML